MIISRLESKKQRGTALVIPLLVFLVLAFMPAASAYSATLVSPANINAVHNGDIVSIRVDSLVENNTFQLNISSDDLNTTGGTFSINNFAMPFGFVNGTASTLLVGDNLNASGLRLVVARADGVTISQQNQTTANPYRIYLTHDILKTSYNVSITGYPQSASGAIIDFSVRGNITSPDNPAFLNFTMSNIQSGHLRIRVNDSTMNQLDTTLTITPNPDKIGVYRNAIWSLDSNGNFAWEVSDTSLSWGLPGDTQVIGDWNGDGKDDIGIFRPSSGIWSLDSNGNFVWEVSDKSLSWGLPNDIPVIGDWNSDGKDDIGIFRPSSGIWSLDSNGNFVWEVSDKSLSWGLPNDIPVIGDWNGDGKDDIGIFRPSSGIWSLDSNGNFVWEVSDKSLSWGLPNDIPVIGDWNSDGKDDMGIFRSTSGIWSLDSNGNFIWEVSDKSLSWGLPNDTPVIGDWNSDGKDDIGIFRSTSGIWSLDSNGNFVWEVSDKSLSWGLPNDKPAVGKWI